MQTSNPIDVFRHEVLEARSGGFTGTRLQAHSPLGRYGLLLALLPALALLGVLAFGESTRKATVRGHLIPSTGEIVVRASAAGTVANSNVAEGDRVHRGDPLMLIEEARATRQAPVLDQLEGGIARRRDAALESLAASGRRAQTRRRSLALQLADVDREITSLDSELPLAREQVRLVAQGLDRLRSLSARGNVAALQVTQREIELIDRQAHAKQLERQALALVRARRALSLELAELDVDSEVQRHEATLVLEAIERERVDARARAEQVLTAPIDGVVSAQLAFAGQTVEPGRAC
jgi:membrane fusion protein